MDLDLFELVKNFGPFAGFTVFFVWQGWIRERRLSERIDQLENRQNDQVAKIATESTAALTRNTLVMEANTEVMENVTKAFERLESVVAHAYPTADGRK